MALKFRRGTTAQQSGSLAFGEPFVNTTLGTLLVGGPNGDIVLSSAGTGSTGNFGAISGSGLDITGNANIAGNLTLGGAITIGDATADIVNIVASVSSSIIPSVTNAFDLGSEDYFWRDIYVSTGSIKFVGAAGNVVGTLTNIGNGLNLDAGIVTKGDSSFGTSSLAVTSVTGSLRVSGSLNVIGGINGVINATNGVVSGSSQIASQISASLSAEHLNSKVAGIVSGSSQVIGILDSLNTFSGSALTRLTALEVETTNLESFTSSINTTIKSKLDADGVISGSSQITLSSTTGFSAYSTSVDSRIATEKGRVDAILLSADADKDSFAEIVTLINSVDTTNDAAFASFYTASVGRLNNLESTSASVNISVSNLNTFSGSTLTRLAALEVETSNLESFTSSINTTIKSKLDVDGVISGSSQITYASISSIPAGIVSGSSQVTPLLPTDVVSGSSQVIGILSSLNTYTGSNDTTNTTQDTRLTALEASASTALSTNNTQDTSITNLNSTTSSLNTSVSNLNSFTSSINTTIKTRLNAEGVVSGSSQITLSSTTGGGTSADVRFGSLGIGIAASGTSGRIDAANDVVAFSSSDIRFKENIKPIENAIDKIRKISGNTYDWKEENKIEHGYEGNDVGVIAQEIEAVLPQLVQTRESGYKAVKYDKLVALLIEGIKEQQLQIEQLKIDLNNCTNNKGL